jgi:hypothetical protein
MITSAMTAAWLASSAAPPPRRAASKGLIERATMTPLALFLLGCATVFLGTCRPRSAR